jgi:hypothetical protein
MNQLFQQPNSSESRNRANRKHKQDKLKELTATLVVEGNPLLRANTIIEVKGVAGVHEGKWYVTKVSHAISKSDYLTTIELSKNATNKSATANSTDLRTTTDNGVINADANKKKEITTESGKTIHKYNANGKAI